DLRAPPGARHADAPRPRARREPRLPPLDPPLLPPPAAAGGDPPALVPQQGRHLADLVEAGDGIGELGLGAGQGEELDELVDQVDLEDRARLAGGAPGAVSRRPGPAVAAEGNRWCSGRD